MIHVETPFTGRDRTLDDLRELVAARADLESREVQLVSAARIAGYSWRELAEVLGMTPQGAGKRYRGAVVQPRAPDDDEPFF